MFPFFVQWTFPLSASVSSTDGVHEGSKGNFLEKNGLFSRRHRFSDYFLARGSFPEVRRMEYEADSSPSTADVKNLQSFTSVSPRLLELVMIIH